MAPTRSSVDPVAQAVIRGNDELEQASPFDTDDLELLSPGPEHLAVHTCSDVLTCARALEKRAAHPLTDLSSPATCSRQSNAKYTAGKPGMVYILADMGRSKSSGRLFTLLALQLRDDGALRWYLAHGAATDTIHHLQQHGAISPSVACCRRGEDRYQALMAKVTTLCDALRIKPDADDFKKARIMTDWSCFIEDPDTAWDRVMNTPYIYHNAKEPFRDMSGDRYLLELEPAKRLLASMVHLSAAQYLLFKRRYFKAFYRDLIFGRDKIPVPARTSRGLQAQEDEAQLRRDEQVTAARARYNATTATPTPSQSSPSNSTPASTVSTRRRQRMLAAHVSGAEAARQIIKAEEDASTIASDVPTPRKPSKATQVRSDKNHIDQIRALLGFGWTNARLVQEAWSAMGLLKEENYVDWIDAGGMFETVGTWQG